jgi:transposase
LKDKLSSDIIEWKGTVVKMGNKKGVAPPRYDDAFKEGAVRLVTEQGRPSREVADELGICVDTLRSWLKSVGIKAGTADRENRQARRVWELETQNRELRKQLTEKQEVIEVLKKSVGILSNP